ncbi:MAG: hypothetical protein WCT19_04800 [Candidatus Paceibacterota bacterium]
MSEEKKNVCVVGYKSASLGGYSYGNRFFGLNECCPEFKKWFFGTGNKKVTSFNARKGAPYDDEAGFNLVMRGNEIQVELRSEDSVCAKTNTMNFCPFCGSKIEVKEICHVKLVKRYKNVHDGFDEEIVKTDSKQEE